MKYEDNLNELKHQVSHLQSAIEQKDQECRQLVVSENTINHKNK